MSEPEGPTAPPRAAAVLLAAGGGTRFANGAKLLASLQGRSLLARAVDPVLEAGLPLVVVQGATDLAPALTEFGSAVTVVENGRWEEGQMTSLRAGIRWCGSAGFGAAVVGLGDQPFVPASAWRAVARAVSSAPIVTASFDGRRRPPVRLEKSVWSLLSEAGDEGARGLMRRRPDLVTEVACEGDPADIDTVDELLARDRTERSGVRRRRAGGLAPP